MEASDKKAADRMVHVRISDEMHRRVRILVASRDETIQDWLSSLIAHEVDRAGLYFLQTEEHA